VVSDRGSHGTTWIGGLHAHVVDGAPGVVGLTGVSTARPRHQYDVQHTTVVHLDRPSRFRLAAKRVLDVLGALVGLLLALPVLLLVAVAIKLDSRGRVIFAQDRVGRGGRLFRCYKLRTMCEDAELRLLKDAALLASYESNHFKLPVEADARVTGLGRLLRTTSLDEIPQFWNVLRGDMSLVGPRPVVPTELTHYGSTRDVLLSVRPGLTGAWAVRGRSRIGYPERASIELGYARSWTIRGDLVILVKTVGVVLQRRGAL
jgi:lipopolysaccharide/colanic/teichoic acid biosynthesis glycosyltransferase